MTKSGQDIDFLQYKSRDPSDQADITKIYLHGDTLKSMGYCISKNKVLDNPFCNLLEFIMSHPTSAVALEVFSGFFENITESRTVSNMDSNSSMEVNEFCSNRMDNNGVNNFSDEVINGTDKKPVYTFVKHLNDDIDIVKIEVDPIKNISSCGNDVDTSFNGNVPKNNLNKRKPKIKKESKDIKTEDKWTEDDFICSMYDDILENYKQSESQLNECRGSKDYDEVDSKITSDEETPPDQVLKEVKYKCKLCHEIFMIKEDLKAHVTELHDPNIANTCICSQCGRMYKNELTKIRHEKKFHGIQKSNDVTLDKSNICPTCGMELRNRYSLENHLKVNHENAFEEPRRCHYYDESGKGSACKKKFLTPYALEMHTSHYHKEGPKSTSSICHYCSEVFKGAKSYVNTRLKTHIEKVHLGIRHNCKQCDKVFMSLKTLKKHEKHVHRKEGHYPCKECGKVFKYYSAAQEHAYVDRGETPFVCQYCDFKSAHSWALAKHRPVCKFQVSPQD